MEETPTWEENQEPIGTLQENNEEESGTWNEVPEGFGIWTKNDELTSNLNVWTPTLKGLYIDNWRGRQSTIDRLWDLAEAALKRGDMAAFEDYRFQIRNFNDDGVMGEKDEY